MKYIYSYLGLGIILLISFWFVSKLSEVKSKNLTRESEFEDNLNHPLLSLAYFKAITEKIFAFSILLLIWPILAVIQIDDFVRGIRSSKVKSYEFNLKKEDLQKQLSQVDIESSEMIFDPLHAVPNLPFGHLNNSWNGFLTKKTDEDELWSFISKKHNHLGKIEVLSGYAIVREGLPITHFIVMNKIIED